MSIRIKIVHMVKRNCILPGILLLLFSTSQIHAQDSSLQHLPSKWDLQACLDYVARNNIQLNTLRLGQEIARQDLLLAKAAKYPNLFGSVGQNLTHSTNANPVVGGYATQSSFSSSYSLGSSWTIYNGGYLNYHIKDQDQILKQAGLSIDQTLNSLVLQVTQDYLDILLARENIVYVEDLLKTSQAQEIQAQQQYDAGSIAKNGLIELQAQTSTDKYNLVSAQNAYRQNVLNLKQLLQLPWNYTMDISVPDTIIATALVLSLEEVQQTALSNRPEIKYAQAGIRAAELNLNMAKAQTLPVATVGTTLASGYSNNQSVDYLKQLDYNFYQRIGLSVSIPIFNNRIYKTQVETGKIEIDEAKLALQGAQTTLSQSVEQAYINVLNAQSQYEAAVVQLKSSQEGYRVATEQFKVGASNLVELLQQKNLYIQALENYTQAKYSAALYIQVYHFYHGDPVKL